jgi:hypothetical protein
LLAYLKKRPTPKVTRQSRRSRSWCQ